MCLKMPRGQSYCNRQTETQSMLQRADKPLICLVETETQEEVIMEVTVMKTGLHNSDLCSNAQPAQSY